MKDPLLPEEMLSTQLALRVCDVTTQLRRGNPHTSRKQHVCEQVWLCANKILFMDTEI